MFIVGNVYRKIIIENCFGFFGEGDSSVLYYAETFNFDDENRAVPVAKNSATAAKQFLLKDNLYRFSVSIQSEFIYHSQQVHLKITNKSPVYDTVIPYEAIHQNQNGAYYVYILKNAADCSATNITLIWSM